MDIKLKVKPDKCKMILCRRQSQPAGFSSLIPPVSPAWSIDSKDVAPSLRSQPGATALLEML